MSRYHFSHSERGIALIIGNGNFLPCTGKDPRPGMVSDVNECSTTFKKMGFHTIVLLDQTCSQMRRSFRTLEDIDHSNFDCVCIVLSSHGTSKVVPANDNDLTDFEVYDEVDYIYGTDGEVAIPDLMESLNEHRCPTLVKKPKLFFLQGCRGTQLCESVSVKITSSSDCMQFCKSDVTHFVDADPVRKRVVLPKDKIISRKNIVQRDFLVMYASPPGYYAFHTDAGSPFLMILCSVLQKNYRDLDLLTMLTKVTSRVATEYESRMSESSHLDKRHIVPCTEHILLDEVFFREKLTPSREITEHLASKFESRL